MIIGEPSLEDDKNIILCTNILAKPSLTTHSNVFNSNNEDSAHKLWKAIAKGCLIQVMQLSSSIKPIGQHNI
ncbi:hypothetical protein VP01_1664g8 [Puccinia sorghi]|uniref:Uncharacterized protein n=1 Tax=Puccinia sorghi TaxID=27349 RepID=A0A0L6VGB4_9BASI|nr:hypothetical protein VP01_1664g8 [Puccinia sorghi]